MSGIAAICGPDAAKKADRLDEMLSRLKHRGPDDEGRHTGEGVVLGIRAKDPVDESRKPVVSGDGSTVVVADAEIVNKSEIQGDSSAGGAGPLTDAEAIAREYARSGASCPAKLDGVFSFVLSDKGKTLAARDPLGARPLYWGKLDGQQVFASELKALAGIATDIKEFPPGHCYDSDAGLSQYFSLPSDAPTETDADAAAKKLGELLEVAVQRRMKPGISTGVLLSGGLDSSVIAAIASRHCENLTAFSACTKDGRDLPFARQVAKHLGLVQEELIYDIDDVLEALPKVIYHLESFDAPLVRSATPNYFISRVAASKVDVVFIGEGGDEDFGGYHHLKRLSSEKELQEAIVRLYQGLHNNGFMRTDRMNAAHSIVARAPFFDTAVLQCALGLHPSLKIHGDDQVEKWILRKAFEDQLPNEVVWRPKQQFARGCGSDEMLGEHSEKAVSDSELEARRAQYPSVAIRSKEEMLYFDIFREHFGDEPSVLATVGQWYE